jgi:hypothetical protein
MKRKIITLLAKVLGEQVHFNVNETLVKYEVQEYQLTEVRAQLEHDDDTFPEYIKVKLKQELIHELWENGAVDVRTIKDEYRNLSISEARIKVPMKKDKN